jgi:FkbM family methyltransferase
MWPVTRLHELALFVKALRDDQARVQYVLARARRAAKDPRRVVRVDVPGFDYPLWMRVAGPDFFTFHQVFIKLEYRHGLPVDPSLIVDAGGNIGLAAVFFAKQYPSAQIFSIEPNDENFEILLQNTRPYSNIRCFKGAVWPTESQVRIANPEEENPASYTVQAANPDSKNALTAFTPLSLMRLAKREQIDIFKIDIEGAELELFGNGSEEWLGRTDLMLVELHDAQRPGCAQAFFSSICRERFTYYQRSETTIVRFDRSGDPAITTKEGGGSFRS